MRRKPFLRAIEERFLPRRWFLRRQLRRVNRLYREALDDLKKKGASEEERQFLEMEWVQGAEPLDEELQALASQRLIIRAERLSVPVPEQPYFTEDQVDENWQRGPLSRQWHLTPAGFSKIRNLIRKERKERREALLAWLPLITALAGLVGALSGLVALLDKWSRP